MEENKYYLMALTKEQKDFLTVIIGALRVQEIEMQENGMGFTEETRKIMHDTAYMMNNVEPQEVTDKRPRYSWFSVKEQMPCYDENVLVQDSYGHHGVAWLKRNLNGSTMWWSCDERLEKEEIVAWMPIEEYKPEEEL